MPAATEGEADGEMAMWFGSVKRKWTSEGEGGDGRGSRGRKERLFCGRRKEQGKLGKKMDSCRGGI